MGNIGNEIFYIQKFQYTCRVVGVIFLYIFASLENIIPSFLWTIIIQICRNNVCDKIEKYIDIQ